jgi:hypothetical protein
MAIDKQTGVSHARHALTRRTQHRQGSDIAAKVDEVRHRKLLAKEVLIRHDRGGKVDIHEMSPMITRSLRSGPSFHKRPGNLLLEPMASWPPEAVIAAGGSCLTRLCLFTLSFAKARGVPIRATEAKFVKVGRDCAIKGEWVIGSRCAKLNSPAASRPDEAYYSLIFFGRFGICLDLNVMARSNQYEENNELHGTPMQRFHASFATSARSLGWSSAWEVCYVKWFPPAVCGLNGSP